MAYKGSSVSKLGPGVYYLVSLAAVFRCHPTLPQKNAERCVTSKKRLRGRLDIIMLSEKVEKTF